MSMVNLDIADTTADAAFNLSSSLCCNNVEMSVAVFISNHINTTIGPMGISIDASFWRLIFRQNQRDVQTHRHQLGTQLMELRGSQCLAALTHP